MTPNDLDPAVIRVIAERALRKERIRVAVEAEKLRILARHSPWSRFLAWLPFTLTWKNNGTK